MTIHATVALGLLLVVAGSALVLLEPSSIRPLWLHYVALAAPAMAGYGARRYVAARPSA